MVTERRYSCVSLAVPPLYEIANLSPQSAKRLNGLLKLASALKILDLNRPQDNFGDVKPSRGDKSTQKQDIKAAAGVKLTVVPLPPRVNTSVNAFVHTRHKKAQRYRQLGSFISKRQLLHIKRHSPI